MRNVLLAVVGLAVFVGLATSAPVPKALLKKPLRATIEPLPGEKVYSVNFDDVPFVKVAEELELATGLMFLSKDVPKVNITLKADKVCLPELFAQLDEKLFPEEWVISRRTQSFAVLSGSLSIADCKPLPKVDVAGLDRRTPHEPLLLKVDTDEAGVKAGVTLGSKKGSGVTATPFGTTGLHVSGNGESLRAFVAEMGDHIKK
jgi:hypothetical protein